MGQVVAPPCLGASVGKCQRTVADVKWLGTGNPWRLLHSHVWHLGGNDLKTGLSWNF